MNRENGALIFITVAFIAAVCWKVNSEVVVRAVVTPTPAKEDGDDPTIVVAPQTLINAATAFAAPFRLNVGVYRFLPPVIPYMENRGAANDGF